MAMVKFEKKIQSAVDRAVSRTAKSRPAKQTSGKANHSGLSSERKLLDGRIPRSSFSVRGDNQSMVVTGLEVVDEVRCAKAPLRHVVSLNPALAAVFPRLSGFSLQFERYRFREVSLEYYSACPATRTGAVGFAVHTEYVGQISSVPLFLPEFAAYQYSCVGSVATSMSTPIWRTRDPEMFFIGSSGGAQIDPLKVYQGSIAAVARDAASADDDTLAGYLAIRYVVEFFNLRPTINKFASAGANADGTQQPSTALTAGSSSCINTGPIRSEVGNHEIESLAHWAGYTNNTFGTTTIPSSWVDIASGISYAVDFFGYLIGAVAEDSDQKSESYVTVREDHLVKPALKRCPLVPGAQPGPKGPPGVTKTSEASDSVKCEHWCNPQTTVGHPDRHPDPEQRYFLQQKASQDRLNELALMPETKGDFMLYLYAVPAWGNNLTCTLLDTLTLNSSAASSTIREALQFTLTPTVVGNNSLASREEENYVLTWVGIAADSGRSVSVQVSSLVDASNYTDAVPTPI